MGVYVHYTYMGIRCQYAAMIFINQAKHLVVRYSGLLLKTNFVYKKELLTNIEVSSSSNYNYMYWYLPTLSYFLYTITAFSLNTKQLYH